MSGTISTNISSYNLQQESDFYLRSLGDSVDNLEPVNYFDALDMDSQEYEERGDDPIRPSSEVDTVVVSNSRSLQGPSTLQLDNIATKIQALRDLANLEEIEGISPALLDTLSRNLHTLSLDSRLRRRSTLLLRELRQLSDKHQVITTKRLSLLPVRVPLLGPVISLEERANAFTSPFLQSGYRKLNTQLKMRIVRGDGHCLFRSVLTFMLEKLLQDTPVARQRKMARLERIVTNYHKPTLTEKFRFFKSAVENAVTRGRSFDTIVSEQSTSDRLVSFLRELVCEYNRVSGNDVFHSHVTTTGKTLNAYLADMMNMRMAVDGDQPETLALSKLFNINICVVDVNSHGRRPIGNHTMQSFVHFSAHPGMMECYLLLRPGHYDLGVPLYNQRNNTPSPAPAPAPSPEEEAREVEHARRQAQTTSHFLEHARNRGFLQTR